MKSIALVFLLSILLSSSMVRLTAEEPENSGTPERPESIVFKSFEEARTVGAAAKKVVVAYFTAKWCGYCRKMEAGAYRDPDVLALSTRFAWAKIDIDRDAVAAARYGIRGVPALVLLNTRGETVARASGYQTAEALGRFLAKHAGDPDAPGEVTKVKLESDRIFEELEAAAKGPEDGDALERAVVEVVTLLASSERTHRKRAHEALIALERRAWPGLVRCLSDGRLATRAAAYNVLTQSTRRELPYDAFAPREARESQAAAWRRAVEG